jgi:4-hydroxy-tetrahydrodipicolinate reductase
MKIAIIGYGKLGKTIEKVCVKLNIPISFIINTKNAEDLQKINSENTDVAIEISTPETAYQNCKTLINAGVNTLCGTTGWQHNIQEIETLANAKKVGFLYASNFSTGVNLFFLLNKYLAKIMDSYEDYDIEASEWHHIHKKDAPSGTAITLLQDILNEIQRKDHFKLIQNDKDTIKPSGVGIHAYREQEIPGIHQIIYCSEMDEITIKHEAKTRESFARGAIKMAHWLKEKKKTHTLSDYLGVY